MPFRFRPRLLDTLSGYSAQGFAADLSAGVTVGVLALPLAMAFAIASGMSPAAGIWTSIVAGLLISLLGGSRVQIGGPTGAFIPIVYAIAATHGVDSLLVATMLSGILLFMMGAFRLGSMIRFIPLSVVIGFTNGIAVVIFLSQLKDFFGLQVESLPGEFFERMHALLLAAPSFQWPTLLLALASLAFLAGWNHLAQRIAWMRRVPGPLAVLLLATAANAALHLPVDTIGSRFGGIPQGVPALTLPALDFRTLGKLIAPALTIALLGAIESLLSARVADDQIDDRHDPNQELMAQGIANFAAPLFGGFAATGAIARTATNIRSGGRTPVAGMAHALVLLLIVLVAAPLAGAIPLATLSAIVVMVSLHMGDWRAFAPAELRRHSPQYRGTLLATFLLTVVFDLTIAVEVGLLLASLTYLFRMSDLTRIEPVNLNLRPDAYGLQRADGTPRAVAYHLFGSLFFGASNKLDTLLLQQPGRPDVVILDMEKVVHIDSTGMDILRNVHRQMAKYGAQLVLCDLNPQPADILRRGGFFDLLGEHGVADSLEDALARARVRQFELME